MTSDCKVRVLYISYDGMLEPLGQSQVLAYQELLALDHQIYLLSYEKSTDWADRSARHKLAARIRNAGISWHPRRYHKRPSAIATSYDIIVGMLTGLWLVKRHHISIVHARSYVPALIALLLKKLTGVKFVFDMRGFWADERVDGGLWPRDGSLYRVAKWLEQRFLLHADHVVSLTHAAVQVMQSFDYLHGRMLPLTVIPTCVDLNRFRPIAAAKQGFVMGYVGTASTWYLFDAVILCFLQLQALRPGARLLIINRGEHDFIRQRLAAAAVPTSVVELRVASPVEVPAFMARMDVTAFFIKPVFSKQASAPTKLGEFLACGIPCLVNTGVGDMAEMLESEGVGVAIKAFDPVTLAAGLERLLALAAEPTTAARCMGAAQRHFSLQEGVQRYASIYRNVLSETV